MDHNYNTRHVSTREQTAGGLFSSPLPFALALIGGGAAIFCLWYFFYSGSHSQSNQPIPVIKAEGGPMKVRPDSASQPEVPHQDKLVYGRVNPAEKGAGVERLLPPTEEPMDTVEHETVQHNNTDAGFPTPHAAAENKSEFRVEPHENKLESAAPETHPKGAEKVIHTAVSEKETTVSVEQLSGTTTPPKQSGAIENKAMESTAREAEPTKSTAATAVPVEAKKEVAPAKTLQSGYRVQLASMKSEDQAKQEWGRLQGEYKGVLGSLSANYARVDLGAKKGIFYRVQAGDFASKADAQNVCNKMKSQNSGVDCFIVKF